MMLTVARPRTEYFCTFGDVYFLHHVYRDKPCKPGTKVLPNTHIALALPLAQQLPHRSEGAPVQRAGPEFAQDS